MKVRVALSLILILGLMLAAAMPSYAGKGGNGNGNDKDKDKDPPANHQKPEKDKGEKGPPGNDGSPGNQKPKDPLDFDDPDVTPTPVPTDTTPVTTTATITICHKPGTPAEKTLVLPKAAEYGHLHHGDYLGPCTDIGPTPTPTDTVPITDTATITVCHKPGTPAEKTLELPASAGYGHLHHGDYLGPCTDIGPTPTPTDTVPVTDTVPITFTVTVTVCHKPGTPAEQTLVVPEPVAPAHLAHGDELGACPDDEPAAVVGAGPDGWRKR